MSDLNKQSASLTPETLPDRETILRRWDTWQKRIAADKDVSWARHEFELLLDGYEEEIGRLRIMCQADDSAKGERSSLRSSPDRGAEADRWHFDAEEIGLLPCPFCGPGNSKVSLWRDDVGCGHWQVNCGRCGGSSGNLPANEHFPNAKQRIIDGWNTRNGELRQIEERSDTASLSNETEA